MIFSVLAEDVAALGDADLRALVGLLCELEAVAAGAPATCVTYGGDQNASDGGVDVRVELPAAQSLPVGELTRRLTLFQVKAENMAPGDIATEMRPGDELRPAIVECCTDGGAYVIVSSKGSVADAALRRRREAMRNAACDAATETCVLDFFDRTRLATWVNRHPGAVAWVGARLGRPVGGWRPFGDWSSSPKPTEAEFLLDGGVRLVRPAAAETPGGLDMLAGIDRIRSRLASPAGGAVRLAGLSGTGKTRFAQALFDSRLGTQPMSPGLVVYGDAQDDLTPSPVQLLTQLIERNASLVLVVDNCGAELHRRLVQRLKQRPAHVGLLTIEYDVRDDEPEGTDVYRLEPSSLEVTERIVQRHYPDLPEVAAAQIAAFAEGNARMALALARGADRSGSSLAGLNDRQLLERLVEQGRGFDAGLWQAAKTLSLVYSFDVESTADASELALLASLVGAEPRALFAHAAELQRRQLLQARSRWRAVLPQALAHKLAELAFEEIPLEDVKSKLVARAGERLLRSFSRRLGCLHGSPAAQALVREWLAADGWIGEHAGRWNDFGLTILDNVAPVDPDAALATARRAVAAGDPAALDERQRIALATLLWRLAYDPQRFDTAAEALVRLVEAAEPTNNVRDPGQLLSALFQPALSGTHAPPGQRAAFLRRLAPGAEGRRFAIVVGGLEAMLELQSRSSNDFDFGTHKRDFGWQARSVADVVDWFETAFGLCRDLLADCQYAAEVRRIVARGLPMFVGNNPLLTRLCTLAEECAVGAAWPEGLAAVRRALFFAQKHANEDALPLLKGLLLCLKPTSLADRLACEVLWNAPGSFLDDADVEGLDGQFDQGKFQAAQAAYDARCAAIGHELGSNREAMLENLPAILASRSPWLFPLARGVAETDPDLRSTWRLVCDALADGERAGAFPIVFARAIAECDPGLAEEIMDDALARPTMHPWLVSLQVSVGLSAMGHALQRLLSAAACETVPTFSFRHLAFGRACDPLPAPEFARLVLAVAARPDDGTGVALEMMHMRLYCKKERSELLAPEERDAAAHVLSQHPFAEDRQRRSSGHWYDVVEVARAALDPTRHADAAKQCLANLAARTDEALLTDGLAKVAVAVARHFPEAALDVLVGDGNAEGPPPRRFRRYGLSHALRDIAPADLVAWARAPGTNHRFARLADAVGFLASPPRLAADALPVFDDADDGPSDAEGWSDAARALLACAPDPVAVARRFRARFGPLSWSGSRAEILARRRGLLEALARDADPALAAWAAGEIPAFDDEIRREREFEAARERPQEQAFDW